jgi:uncharacterized protein HemX
MRSRFKWRPRNIEEAGQMRASLSRRRIRRSSGPIASALALALAAGLAASSWHAHKREAALQAQIAALTQRNQQADLVWQAKLSTCHAEAAAPAVQEAHITRVAEPEDSIAARLAGDGPAGFDACARMQAADAAVLGSLHRRK